MNTPIPNWRCPNNCINWAREFTLGQGVTAHHPNCEHYNASLMDVWTVRESGYDVGGCVMDSLPAAEEMLKYEQQEPGSLVIVPGKMHRELGIALGMHVDEVRKNRELSEELARLREDRRALVAKVSAIAGDFIPSHDREIPHAFQEMRDALETLVAEQQGTDSPAAP